MRIAALVCVSVMGLLAGCRAGVGPQKAQTPSSYSATRALDPLPTGRFISPQTLSSQNVGSFPVNLVASADGHYAISTDAGFHQSLWAIRINDGMGVSQLQFAKGRPSTQGAKMNGLYYGLAAAPGVIYAAQGGDDCIAVIDIDAQGHLTWRRQISTRKGDFPSGIALDGAGRLYVANNDPGAQPPIFRPSSVAIYDSASGKELGRYDFSDSFGGTPNFPYALTVTKDGTKLYVASERDSLVYALDTTDPAHIKPITQISTGSQPSSLLLDVSEKHLFVANAGSDTISFVDTSTNAVVGTVLLRPDVARSLAGATPTGLALSADAKFLYVSLGDMNAVAVIDVADRELEGYIAAGWYPSAVLASRDGKRLLVANAKGTAVRNPNPPPGQTHQQSPLNFIEGNVVSVAVPGRDDLKKQTERVLEYNRLTPKFINQPNPLSGIGREAGKITHVIYIVKENRSYDQVLGDMPQGNGNADYAIFGRSVTPNQHALAERFGLMDNFYDCGEVSGEGWTWSTQAMANEYTVRNVPYQYSGRGRHYDYEGTNNGWPTGGFPATGPDGKPLSGHPAFKDGMKPIPDVAEAPGGHLWDMVRKHHLSYRNYGFFVNGGVRKDGVQVVPDNYPSSAGLQPAGRDLGGVTDIDFRDFDLGYPDSEAWKIYYDRTRDETFKWRGTQFGQSHAPSRFSEWHREFEQMLAKDPSGGAVPSLMTVRFCTDHTVGGSPGMKSPRAMVADNDYAVGQLVETVSRSPIWKNTAIFIIEDDAQNGPDHVDAHRSTCFVISPWIKRGGVDHAFYNTTSCLRTIELLLGIPPMCQYDAIAASLGQWDTQPANAEPFSAILPQAAIIGQTNRQLTEAAPDSAEAELMRESMKMNFVVADRAPADQLNQIIWKMCRGYDAKLPSTPNGINGVKMLEEKDSDGD